MANKRRTFRIRSNGKGDYPASDKIKSRISTVTRSMASTLVPRIGATYDDRRKMVVLLYGITDENEIIQLNEDKINDKNINEEIHIDKNNNKINEDDIIIINTDEDTDCKKNNNKKDLQIKIKEINIKNTINNNNNKDDDIINNNNNNKVNNNDGNDINKGDANVNGDCRGNDGDEKKKINNTIFINNSNVTISNRNNKEENKLKELNNINNINNINNEIKNNFNCFNTNEENIELDDLLNKVFSGNIKANSNNKNFLTDTDMEYQYNKEYFDQLYSEQSQYDINSSKIKNENDENIINKLKEIKDKIDNKNKPKKKKSKNKKEFHTFNPHNMSRSMNNKQIRKNIPTYRKNTPTHNNNFIYNSFTFDKNKHFKGYKKFNNLVCFSLENSFNKSLCSSLLGKSVRDPFYNASHNRNYSLRKKTSMSRMRAKDTPTRFNMQQSYINNSSMFNISSSYMRTQNIIKKNKEKRLYNVVTKNLRRNSNTYKSKRNKRKSYEKKNY